MINELSRKGITVFVTTHYLEEAEYCSRIMMIDSGKIIAGGSPQELKTKYLKQTILEIECEKPNDAIDILDKISWISNTAYFGEYLHATLDGENLSDEEIKEKIAELTRTLVRENSIKVYRIEKIVPSIEDVFVNLMEVTS